MTNNTSNSNEVEICHINAGITDINRIHLPTTLKYLNLHCNVIKTINNLSCLTQLKHLDLSSNQIKDITGISTCSCLQTLNLACNLITKVDGIRELRSLRKLNLSYNSIQNLSGFKEITKRTHSLEHLILYGNKIESVKEIIQNLNQCTCLKIIYFSKNDDSNPVCNLPSYKPNIWSQLPWLECLDGQDKFGSLLNESIDSRDIPGLDEYLELLMPSSNGNSVEILDDESEEGNIVTPKIDSALEKFRNKVSTSITDVSSSSAEESQVAEHPYEAKQHQEDNEMKNRLLSLEKTFCTFAQLYTHEKEKKHTTFEKLNSSSGDSISSPATVSSFHTRSKQTRNNNEQVPKAKQSNRKTNANNLIVKGNRALGSKIPQKQKSILKENVSSNVNKQVRSPEDDETYLALMHEMDSERERRWKAEQATKKLLDTIKSLQERLIEGRKIQEAAISSSTKYKQQFEQERTARNNFETLANKLEADLLSTSQQNEELKENFERSKNECEELKKIALKLQQEKDTEEIHHTKLYHNLQYNAGGTKRELSLLNNTTQKQKEQISQLQDLMISREQEHKSTMEKMVYIDGCEVHQLIEKEITKIENKNLQLIQQYKDNLDVKSKEYKDLEDEFRMALQIEANRYNELHSMYEDIRDEYNDIKSSFETTCQKESKARSLIADLSSMVKEQKIRISEITKSKQDIQAQYKERIQTLDIELLELRKVASKYESIQQDKDRLAAHIRGQESVIQGLRSERKLWGQELAQQGASLAQERGRLDVQVETQHKEIISLKTSIQDHQESLRIKCKLIDDQTETIRSVKEELQLLTNKNKSLGLEEQKEREYLEKELDKYKENNEDLQETVETLTDRKEELKSQLSSVEEDLRNTTAELKSLTKKWDDRSKIIDQFEGKVYKMKSTFEQKEQLLIKEKEDAIKKNRELESKLSSLIELQSKELRSLEETHQLEVRKTKYQMDNELQQANEKVLFVEEEMRLLLNEKVEQKKNLEIRILKLNKAFKEIQNDL